MHRSQLVDGPGSPDGFTKIKIDPNKNGSYSWGKVETQKNISTNFFASVKLTPGEGTKTVELVGHSFFFVVDYKFRGYLLWNSEENMTKWLPLPEDNRSDLSNTLGLHQIGRAVYLFFNGKYLDSFELWDEPSSGPIGLYFKTDSISGGQASFQRFNIWEF